MNKAEIIALRDEAQRAYDRQVDAICEGKWEPMDAMKALKGVVDLIWTAALKAEVRG